MTINIMASDFASLPALNQCSAQISTDLPCQPFPTQRATHPVAPICSLIARVGDLSTYTHRLVSIKVTGRAILYACVGNTSIMPAMLSTSQAQPCTSTPGALSSFSCSDRLDIDRLDIQLKT